MSQLSQGSPVVEFGQQIDEPLGTLGDCLLIHRRRPVGDCCVEHVVVCGGEGSAVENVAFGLKQRSYVTPVGEQRLCLGG